MASTDDDFDFTVGDYQLLDGVARDAVSETWLASPAGNGGPTRTLLRLAATSSKSSSVRRAFLAELRQLLETPTPGLVRLREVARCDAGVAAVYEDTLSISVEEILDSEPVPAPIAVRWLTELASVLSVLHGNSGTSRTSARLCHGDLRPRNVLVTHGGVVALRPTGLGAAWREHAASGKKVAHLAPEQRDGSAGDARSEVWSLARLGCLMLGGEADGEGEPRVAAGLSSELSQVFEKALSVDPARRQANPGTFGAELRQALGKGAADQADVGSWFDGVWGRDLAAQRIERRSDLRLLEAAVATEAVATDPSEAAPGGDESESAESDAAATAGEASDEAAGDEAADDEAADDDDEAADDAEEAAPAQDADEPEGSDDSSIEEKETASARPASTAKRKPRAGKRSRKGKKRRPKPATTSAKASSGAPSAVNGKTASSPSRAASDEPDEPELSDDDDDDDDDASPFVVPEKKSNLPLVLGGIGIAALALLVASALGGSDKDESGAAKPAGSVKAKAAAEPDPAATTTAKVEPAPTAEPEAKPEPEPEPESEPEPEPEPEPTAAPEPKPVAAPAPAPKPKAPAAPVKKPVAAPAPAPKPATTAPPAEAPPVAGFPDAPTPKPFKPKPPETGIPSGI